MHNYTINDLRITEQAIDLIRKRCDWFGGAKPRAHYLAACLLRDLIFLNETMIKIEKIHDWWVIYVANDWLSDNGVIDLGPFYRMINFPQIGVNSIRSEVLITALADVAVTSGADGVVWLTGSSSSFSLPAEIDLNLHSNTCGRILAFLEK